MFAAGADDARAAADQVLSDDAEQVTEHDDRNRREERRTMHRERCQRVADRRRREHAHRHHEAADQHAPERDAAHHCDGVGAEVQPASSGRVNQRAQSVAAEQRAGEYGEGGEGDIHAT